MHDLRSLRENPSAFDAAMAARGLGPLAGELIALDEKARTAATAAQAAEAERNALAAQIGKARAAGATAEFDRLRGLAEARKSEAAGAREEADRLEAELRARLAELPNAPAPDAPAGADETGNVEVRRWGEPASAPWMRDHVDLGARLGLMDFEAAARMSGARFVALKGPLARLHRALGQFMLDLQTREMGYEEVAPPLLVRDQAMFGTGQLPKFAAESFATTDGRWLIPTSEVSLANLVREQILTDADLPRRYAALTPCFRSEAGASGKDTRGMIRMHQFDKVELVSITTPDGAAAELERKTACAEAVLKRLELPYRVMLLCAGDMGFSARKTYDLEAWLPGQGRYREISSCSDCGEFQARRMGARYRPEGEKGTRFVATLNGSGLAVGRTLVALMENYQDEGGRIAIPQALHPYLPGLTEISSA